MSGAWGRCAAAHVGQILTRGVARGNCMTMRQNASVHHYMPSMHGRCAPALVICPWARRATRAFGREPLGVAFRPHIFPLGICPALSLCTASRLRPVLLYHIPPLPSCTTSGMPPALHRDSQDGAARRACAEPASQVHGRRMLSRAARNGVAGGKLELTSTCWGRGGDGMAGGKLALVPSEAGR